MPKKGEQHSPQTIRKISAKRKGQPSPTKGVKKTRLQKEKISVGRKGQFQWIKDKKLYDLILRDYAIANLCFYDELNKPAIILYAGVLEAMLRHWLKKGGRTEFVNLINEARDKELISESNINKLHVLKDFRNYVHISRELKEDFKLTNGIAQFAQETCESVTKELQGKEKIRDNIEENKEPVTNRNFTRFREIESKILADYQKRYGGEMKTLIHYMYGQPDKPLFTYTPDATIQTKKELIFIEIKYILKPEFAKSIVDKTLKYLNEVHSKLLPSIGNKKFVIKFILASGYDLSKMSFKTPKGIEIEYYKV